MNREQLAHVLRAAARMVDDGDIVVVGSQAILGTYDSDDLPEETTMSVEAEWPSGTTRTKRRRIASTAQSGSTRRSTNSSATKHPNLN